MYYFLLIHLRGDDLNDVLLLSCAHIYGDHLIFCLMNVLDIVTSPPKGSLVILVLRVF